MTIHRLTASQLVPAGLDRTWAFFSDPANLGRITPPELDFTMLSAESGTRAGQHIEYTIRPIAGIPMRWESRIEDVAVPHTFTDVQVRGPYRRWRHRHTFTPVDGGTRIDDEIEYELPFGPLGTLAHAVTVRAQLQSIFAFRERAISAIFEPAPTGESRGPTVAIVGGTGFVGAAIASELRRRGCRVIAVSDRGEAARRSLPDDIEIRVADVLAGDGLDEALQGVDRVVTSLALPGSPIERPDRGWTFDAVDAAGTERVVAAAVANGVRRFAYLSGAGAAPDAARHWFRAKWRAEEAVRASGMTWTIVRPTWIFGPRDVSLNRFLGFARTLPFVPLTSLGSQHLAPIFVDDVAGIVADALLSDAAVDTVLEVGGPETMTMREIVRRALRVVGSRRPAIPAPAPMVKAAAYLLQYLPGRILTPDAVDFVNQPAAVDVRPLLDVLPRRLTTLEEGLATYLGPSSPAGRSVSIT